MASLDEISGSVPSLVNVLQGSALLDDKEKLTSVIDVLSKFLIRFHEFLQNYDDMSTKWNAGKAKLQEFTSAPAVTGMAVQEIGYRTNGDFYVKTASGTISVYVRDSTIT